MADCLIQLKQTAGTTAEQSDRADISEGSN